jgi:hypothetical protein
VAFAAEQFELLEPESRAAAMEVVGEIAVSRMTDRSGRPDSERRHSFGNTFS